MGAQDNLSPQQFYHGTSETAARRIEAQGLTNRNAEQGVWHVTSDLGYAAGHAADQQSLGRGHGAVVFAVNMDGIPHESGKSISGMDGHFVGTQTIPPERLRRLDRKEW